jgi:hypothetical protein
LKVLLAYHRRRRAAVRRKAEGAHGMPRNGGAKQPKTPISALFGAVLREKRPVKV